MAGKTRIRTSNEICNGRFCVIAIEEAVNGKTKHTFAILDSDLSVKSRHSDKKSLNDAVADIELEYRESVLAEQRAERQAQEEAVLAE